MNSGPDNRDREPPVENPADPKEDPIQEPADPEPPVREPGDDPAEVREPEQEPDEPGEARRQAGKDHAPAASASWASRVGLEGGIPPGTWIGLGILCVLLAGVLVWRGFDRIQGGLLAWRMEEHSSEEPPPPPLLEVSEDMQEVVLFFPRMEGDGMGVEATEVFDLASPIARGKLILEQLIAGPESADLSPALPAETLVRRLWISAEGTAYVDFSRQLGREHPGGTTAELHSVFAVVNSLAYNLAEVKRVQILIEGNEVDTLHGHLALWMPLAADYSLVRSSDPEAEALSASISKP